MGRKFSWLLAAALLLSALALPVSAQDDEPLATGLLGPRNLAFGEDGTLYIAEAGTGGATEVNMAAPGGDPAAEGPKPTVGLSARISTVAPDGTQGVLAIGLPSLSFGMETLGVSSVQPNGDTLWVTLNEGAPNSVINTALLGLDAGTLRVHTYVDLMAYEIANNPDGTEEIYSNPSDVEVADDGTLFIVDTGANTLYTWTPDAGLQVFHTWTDDPVPTSVQFGAEGDIYVGFLGMGIAPGAGHIERWTREGELVETFEGLTAVTSILIDDAGTLYAVQMLSFGEQGPAPNSGSVVTVTADGATPVKEGLNMPYGIAQAPDGRIVVSTDTAFGPADAGTVVLVQ